MAFNKAILMGRLTADPELKATPSGISVISFSLAVDRRYQKEGEEKKTDFINIVAYRQTAEFISRYFHKGNLILVSGEIQSRTWKDKEGNNRYGVEIAADEVSFCGKENTGSTNATTLQQPESGSPAVQTPAPQQTAHFEELKDDQDLPF